MSGRGQTQGEKTQQVADISKIEENQRHEALSLLVEICLPPCGKVLENNEFVWSLSV